MSDTSYLPDWRLETNQNFTFHFCCAVVSLYFIVQRFVIVQIVLVSSNEYYLKRVLCMNDLITLYW